MVDKLGIVTNCLAERLAKKDRFEDLIDELVQNGFMHIEIRDGSYLRESTFGEILHKLETAMLQFSDGAWQRLCLALHNRNSNLLPHLRAQDLCPVDGIVPLLEVSPEIVLSYAMAHPWTSRPENTADDDACIIRAKKIAYLLSPTSPRLRLVDLMVEKPLDENAALFNLRRYRSLAPECPVTLAVENSAFPPHTILNLAVQSKVHLAYDEANIYYQDGTTMGDNELFWESVCAHQLASVHLKQKNHFGVCARLGEGFVDVPGLIKRLSDIAYVGDWLLEYQATDQPIQDAIHSREVLLKYKKQKGVNQ